jgi:hypothetical protein
MVSKSMEVERAGAMLSEAGGASDCGSVMTVDETGMDGSETKGGEVERSNSAGK